MILTIDIGNTNIAIGGFSDDRLEFVVRIATDAAKTADEYAGKLLSVLALHGVERTAISGAIISSVVPPLNKVMADAVRFIYGVEPLMVGPGIKTGINIRCDTPSSVGADLICGCVAAHHIYGSPSLIVDMGTATKMMVVNRAGAFIGVSIIPGVRMGMRALSEGTAQLPQVSLEAPPSVIGKNTPDCMRAGVVRGGAIAACGLAEHYKRILKLPMSTPLVVCGGYAEAMRAYLPANTQYMPELTLRGLMAIHRLNQK